MKTVILGLLLTISVQAFAQIQYRPIELFKEDPTRGNRTEWDQTGRFCYSFRGTSAVTCSIIVQLGEVHVREKGAFPQDAESQAYISKLSPQALEIASRYRTLRVRYIAFGDNSTYTVHVYNGGETLMGLGTYAVGSATGTLITKINSFSYSPGDSQTKEPKGPDGSGIMLDTAIKADPNSDLVKAMMAAANDLLVVGDAIAQIHLNMNPPPVISTNVLPARR